MASDAVAAFFARPAPRRAADAPRSVTLQWRTIWLVDAIAWVLLGLPLGALIVSQSSDLGGTVGGLLVIGVFLLPLHAYTRRRRRQLRETLLDGRSAVAHVVEDADTVLFAPHGHREKGRVFLLRFEGVDATPWRAKLRLAIAAAEALPPTPTFPVVQSEADPHRAFAAAAGRPVMLWEIERAAADPEQETPLSDGFLDQLLGVRWVRWLLVGALAASTVAAVAAAVQRVALTRDLPSFVDVPGKIVDSRVQDGRLVLIVGYEVGKLHHRLDYRQGLRPDRKDEPRELTARYPVGTPVTVHADPDNPARAVLTRDVPLAGTLGAPILLAGLLAFLLVWLRKRRRR